MPAQRDAAGAMRSPALHHIYHSAGGVKAHPEPRQAGRPESQNRPGLQFARSASTVRFVSFRALGRDMKTPFVRNPWFDGGGIAGAECAAVRTDTFPKNPGSIYRAKKVSEPQAAGVKPECNWSASAAEKQGDLRQKIGGKLLHISSLSCSRARQSYD